VSQRIPVLLYALSGGVVWWVIHLVGTSALAREACVQDVSWTVNGLTVLTAVGAASALWASFVVRHDPSAVAVATGRSRFLGDIAVLFNIIALALIFLEGLPPLFLGLCR
jgi:hypothetical protein